MSTGVAFAAGAVVGSGAAGTAVGSTAGAVVGAAAGALVGAAAGALVGAGAAVGAAAGAAGPQAARMIANITRGAPGCATVWTSEPSSRYTDCQSYRRRTPAM